MISYDLMTLKDLEDFGYDKDELIVFQEPDFDGCIIGVSTDCRVIYSYEKMAEWYMKKFNCTFEEAIESIDGDTVKSLSYMQKCPIILDDL